MRSIFVKSGLVTLVSMFASVAVAKTAMGLQGIALDTNGYLMSLVCPLVIAWPASAWTMAQKRAIAMSHDELATAHAELARAHAMLAEQAVRDPRTGLLNREAFFDRLKGTADATHRGLLLIIDADHFKAINDTYGHESGDRALVEIASAIARGATTDALVGRIGGEEFAVYLPISDSDRARDIALNIRGEVAAIEFYPRGERRLPLTVSIGGAELTSSAEVTKAMRLADRRLYAAKGAGRDRVGTRNEDADRRAA